MVTANSDISRPSRPSASDMIKVFTATVGGQVNFPNLINESNLTCRNRVELHDFDQLRY